VRTGDDFKRLFEASRSGNYPMLRAYSGTDDFLRLADLLVNTIHNTWCAIPIFWFNRMDGRGPWDLEGSIRQHQEVMAWYGAHDIPVEVNEPHHWGLRDAPDVVFVAAAYLSAYNARAFGVRDYIAQMMFNSPPAVSDGMDLAKMLACLEIIAPLESPQFRIWRQTRTGLLSYPLDPDAARAHLAASTYLQMALKPHIVHVVGYTEAHHAATASEVVEGCKLAHRAIENALQGQPNMLADPAVLERKDELMRETRVTIDAIRTLAEPGVDDPLTDPMTLARAVTTGILDAPHLTNNPYGRGQIVMQADERGACIAVDRTTGCLIPERERVTRLLAQSLPAIQQHT
jgi:hypothetical protein